MSDFDIDAFNRAHIAKLQKIAKKSQKPMATAQRVESETCDLSKVMDMRRTSDLLSEVHTPSIRPDAVSKAPTTILDDDGESLEALAARKTRDIRQAQLNKATEQAISANARRNAQAREQKPMALLMKRLIEVASFRDERGTYVKKDERKAFIKQLRSDYASDDCERANLASRHAPEKRQAAIMAIIKGMHTKYRQKYCYPSQETIQWMLWRHYGIVCAISTLNNDMDALTYLGYIKRTRRISRVGGRIAVASTLYFITNRGGKFLAAAKKLYSFLLSTVFQNFGDYWSDIKISEGKEGKGQTKDSPSGDIQDGFTVSWVEQWEFV